MKLINPLNILKLNKFIEDIKKREIEKKLNRLPLINYFKFENEFRGSEALITERQEPYTKFFIGSKNILDIGCGRGEFLKLLRQRKIIGMGIDTDDNMVDKCKKQGLVVSLVDVFDYLLSCKENFHDGIVALQVTEHLNPRRVQNLVKLCYEKTKKNKYVIFETINPACIQALCYFWADFTHIRPIVPEVLKFIFKQYGFREVDIYGRTPIVDSVNDFVKNPKDLALYGDYAIIAKK